MSYSVSLTKRTNGGYTLVADSDTSYLSDCIYHGNSDGVILFSRGLVLKRFYRPSEWTIQSVTGYTTVLQVVNALDALGVISADALDDIKGLLTTIDADTGNIAGYTSTIKDLSTTIDADTSNIVGHTSAIKTALEIIFHGQSNPHQPITH